MSLIQEQQIEKFRAIFPETETTSYVVRPDGTTEKLITRKVFANLIELEAFLKESMEAVEKEWKDRGILTDCHGCGMTMHIFPEDVQKLMYPSLEQIAKPI